MPIDKPKSLDSYPKEWLEAVSQGKEADEVVVYIYGPASYNEVKREARRFRAFRKTAEAEGLLNPKLSYRTRTRCQQTVRAQYWHLVLKIADNASEAGRSVMQQTLRGNGQ